MARRGRLRAAARGSRWEFSQTWIILGLAGYAFSFLVGLLFISPESGRIHRLIGEQGAGHREVRRRIKRIFLVSRIELVILFLVVVDMVVKPGL